jgi:hypothetical protein
MTPHKTATNIFTGVMALISKLPADKLEMLYGLVRVLLSSSDPVSALQRATAAAGAKAGYRAGAKALARKLAK